MTSRVRWRAEIRQEWWRILGRSRRFCAKTRRSRVWRKQATRNRPKQVNILSQYLWICWYLVGFSEFTCTRTWFHRVHVHCRRWQNSIFCMYCVDVDFNRTFYCNFSSTTDSPVAHRPQNLSSSTLPSTASSPVTSRPTCCHRRVTVTSAGFLRSNAVPREFPLVRNNRVKPFLRGTASSNTVRHLRVSVKNSFN